LDSGGLSGANSSRRGASGGQNSLGSAPERPQIGRSTISGGRVKGVARPARATSMKACQMGAAPVTPEVRSMGV
jgi:hypothetical protein